MPRRIAQVSMFDHQIDDEDLLSKLVDWEELASREKVARDAYSAQDKSVKELILARPDLPSGKARIRCGPYVIKLRDIEAGEVKSRRKKRRAVKIDRADK